MKIELLINNNKIRQVATILHELRQHLDINTIIETIKTETKNGYVIAYVIDKEEILGVVGFRIQYKLAWGRHIYIDDLITKSTSRSLGTGKKLLDYVKEYAVKNNCKQLHLDSGVQRYEAHKFYFREALAVSSFHFKQEII